jgi:hypothetical protein
VLGKDQGHSGDATGELAWTEKLIFKLDQAIGQLGYARERENLGLVGGLVGEE